MTNVSGVCNRVAGAVTLALTLLFAFTVSAQNVAGASNGSSATAESVPHLIRLSGTLNGQAAGLHGVTFAVYRQESGDSPLWFEIQNVTLSAQGHYSVLLGVMHSEGVPAELFAANEARWLGVRVDDQEEQPRVLLVSVPYAMKAGDADTVGGLPPSAFQLAAPVGGGTAASGRDASATGVKGAGGKRAAGSIQPTNTVTGTTLAGYVPKFTDSLGTETDSLIYDSGTRIGINTTTPGSLLDLHDSGPALSLTGTDPTQIEELDFNDGSALGGIIQYRNASNGLPKLFRMGAYAPGSQFGIFTGGTERVRLDATGNMGIGTTTPSSILELSTVSPELRLTSTSSVSTPEIVFYEGANLGAIFQYRNSGVGAPNLFRLGGYAPGSQFVILTSAAERVRVDAAGNMGIGTTTPSQMLEVAGSIKATGASGYFFPDASNQIKAALTDVSGGGLQVANGAGVRTLSLLSSCATNQLLKWNGAAWACADDVTTVGSGGGPVAFSGSNTTQVVLATQNGPGITNPSQTNAPPAALRGEATSTTNSTVGVFGNSAGTFGFGVVGFASGTPGSTDNPSGVVGWALSTSGKTRGVTGLAESPNGIAVDAQSHGGAMLFGGCKRTTRVGSYQVQCGRGGKHNYRGQPQCDGHKILCG